MSPSKTGIHFENTLTEKPGLSILYYLYFYNGGGVAIGDINNDQLPDIYFTANYKGGNKLYINKGNLEFEDITEKAGVAGISDWASGVTMADVNGDGYLDIYVSTVSNRYGLKGHNELYINNKNNTFSEKSEQFGLNTSCFTTQSAFFDYDKDGDLDCYILNQSHHPHANIVDTLNRQVYDTLSGDRLYRNDLSSKGKFTNVSKIAGIYQSNLGYGLGLAIGDLNNDGWDDIYIGNDFHENDYYYVNNKKGSYIESGAKHFKHYSRFSMGNDIADYNNDGQLDLITVDMLPDNEKILKTYGSDENLDIYNVKLKINGYQHQFSKNSLQRNNGNGVTFSETSLLSGVSATDWSWAPLFADFDNDGNKDLFISSGIVKRPVDLDYVKFVSSLQTKKRFNASDEYDQDAINAMPDGSSHPFVFKGDGDLIFKDMSKPWGTEKMKGYYTGASYADLDNDGDLDLVINSINEKAKILKNNSKPRNFVQFAFKGDGNNTFGIGTKVYLFTNKGMQYQQLMTTRGFQSSVSPTMHFGLGVNTTIDSILVVWPHQKRQIIKNITINNIIKLTSSEATNDFDPSVYFPPTQPLLNEITNKVLLDWVHKENDFIDFNKQYLIPHELSTRGPKIAVGDVNKDGLDDFYICGASEQSGALMLQTKEGNFKQSDKQLFEHNATSEEVDALFFDANRDGFLDLYVVSGGNQFNDGSTQLSDRLYLNDKRGHFIDHSVESLPIILKNKSCVSAADIDKDGDLDLFVGGLADASNYGIAQDSYLLINDGKANFSIADSSIINVKNLGLVTTATFSNCNKDDWPDLIITGEWMPIKIFTNNKGKFNAKDIPSSTGLWQTVMSTDVNQDGLVDLLAGNLGHNSKLYAGKDGPLKLYLKDFDKNGSLDPIIAYTMAKKEYTFLAKDELERQIPLLKKAYLTYSEVAGKDIKYMFYDLFKEFTELNAATLGSACFMNKGSGKYIKFELPEMLQLAPIYSFSKQPYNQYLAMGNLYGVIPYEGRYDALQPTFFNFGKKSKIFYIHSILNNVNGEIRDAKWLNFKNNTQLLVVGVNNGKLKIFEKK